MGHRPPSMAVSVFIDFHQCPLIFRNFISNYLVNKTPFDAYVKGIFVEIDIELHLQFLMYEYRVRINRLRIAISNSSSLLRGTLSPSFH